MERHQMALEHGGHIPEVVSAVNSISENPSTPPPVMMSPGHVMQPQEEQLRLQMEGRPGSPRKIEVTTPHGKAFWEGFPRHI